MKPASNDIWKAFVAEHSEDEDFETKLFYQAEAAELDPRLCSRSQLESLVEGIDADEAGGEINQPDKERLAQTTKVKFCCDGFISLAAIRHAFLDACSSQGWSPSLIKDVEDELNQCYDLEHALCILKPRCLYD